MRILKEIKFDKARNVYIVTSKEGQGQYVVEEYSPQDYTKMLNMFKQAQLASGQPVSDVVSLDDVETEKFNQVAVMQKGLEKEIASDISLLNQQYTSLKQIVDTSLGDRQKLFGNITETISARMDELNTTMKAFREREQHYENMFNNVELRRAEAIEKLQSMNHVTWEQTQKSLQDFKSNKAEIEKFRDDISDKLKEIEREKGRIGSTIDEKLYNADAELSKVVTAYRERVKSVEKTLEDKQKLILERRKKEEEIKIKKKFIDKELKVKRERDLDKLKILKSALSEEENKLDKQNKKLSKEAKKLKKRANKVEELIKSLSKKEEKKIDDAIETLTKEQSELSKRIRETEKHKQKAVHSKVSSICEAMGDTLKIGNAVAKKQEKLKKDTIQNTATAKAVEDRESAVEAPSKTSLFEFLKLRKNRK